MTTVPDTTASNAAAADTTVLVVGAGPAGLSMAILLTRFGLETIVVERRSGVNPHPRARSINVRTAELMRQWGVLDEIEAVSLPLPWTEQFVYCETLAGTEIGRITTGVQPVVDGVELSSAPWLLTSQDRIEEILLRRLHNVPEVQICWDTELAGC
ncbi:FAD-dependent monooxygenase [Candidatus Poriferisodalis sp.]|uniref:FAD-dependent monooxygenase n=1 Tax=Candidatus Poriferisodalis sp. TaxID=3101277 RepID=UPI003B0166E6